MKKLADDEDKSVSFMAKLGSQKGNSANIKISLKDQAGNNILNGTLFFIEINEIVTKICDA